MELRKIIEVKDNEARTIRYKTDKKITFKDFAEIIPLFETDRAKMSFCHISYYDDDKTRDAFFRTVEEVKKNASNNDDCFMFNARYVDVFTNQYAFDLTGYKNDTVLDCVTYYSMQKSAQEGSRKK